VNLVDQNGSIPGTRYVEVIMIARFGRLGAAIGLAVLQACGGGGPGGSAVSCDLETDELSRDETAAAGRPYFVSNLEVGTDGAVSPGQEIAFRFDVDRLGEAGNPAVGARIVISPQSLTQVFAYPQMPAESGTVTGAFSAIEGKSGQSFCGDLQIISDPNVTSGPPVPLSNAVPFEIHVQ
jgi:hypothetical protein